MTIVSGKQLPCMNASESSNIDNVRGITVPHLLKNYVEYDYPMSAACYFRDQLRRLSSFLIQKSRARENLKICTKSVTILLLPLIRALIAGSLSHQHLLQVANFPPALNENAVLCREALTDITKRVLKRVK